MWGEVAKELKPLYSKLVGAPSQYKILQEQLTRLSVPVQDYSCEGDRSRKEKKRKQEYEEILREIQQLRLNYPLWCENILQRELDTEESLLYVKNRLEARLNVYIRAALYKKIPEPDVVGIALTNSNISQDTYKKFIESKKSKDSEVWKGGILDET